MLLNCFPQSRLDSITNIISQELQDGDISPTEFHKVLQHTSGTQKSMPFKI